MKYLYILIFLSFSIEHATTLNNGTVILATRNSGASTEYRELNSFKAISLNGTLIWESNLSEEGNYPGSFYHIMDMKGTSDGGWVVSGGMFDCDYYSFGFVVKFNANFEEEWIVKSHEIIPNGYIGEFYRLQVNNDKLHFYSFSDIMTLDYSGNLLAHIDLSNSYFSFAVANESQIYAHTIDLGWHILSYPEGNLINEDLPFPDELSRIEILNEEANIFALFGFQSDVKIFQGLNEILEVQYSSDLERVIFFDNENNDFGLAKLYSESTMVSLYNEEDASLIANGEFNFPADVEIAAFTASGNQIVATGKERYVPISYYEKKNVAVAFSQTLSLEIDFPQPTLDLAITDLSVANPVTTSVFEVYPDVEGQQYNFTDIEMTITNNSAETIHSFSINTNFETSTYNFFCNSHLDFMQSVENVALSPGQSQTIYIDTLTTYAVNDTAGYQLCFWVSNPNNELDLVGDNDISCTDFIKDFTSSTENPLTLPPLKIYPNPTSDYLYFEESSPFTQYAIFSLEGKRVESGNCQQGQVLDVRELAKGIYFLQVSSGRENYKLKFVKQ